MIGLTFPDFRVTFLWHPKKWEWNGKQGMKDERLAALIELQSVITKKYHLYREHEAIPGRLDLLRGQIGEAEAKLQAAERAIKENQAVISRARKDLLQTQEKLASVQSKLNQVKTTREYESRQKEIKQQREHLADLDKFIGESESQTAAIEQAVEAAQRELDSIRERLGPEIGQLEGESVQFEQELEGILGSEHEKRVKVPGTILERIDKLVLMRGGMAVVPVQDGCCGGCGIQLSPQMIQVAKRGLDLLQCDRCSSYLYWEGEED